MNSRKHNKRTPKQKEEIMVELIQALIVLIVVLKIALAH